MDWHIPYWNEEMNRLLCEQLVSVDSIILGRMTYLKMANYWKKALLDVHFPKESYPLAVLLNTCRKIVFSSSPVLPQWGNTVIINSIAVNELKKIKQEQGRNLMILGSGHLFQSLIRAEIIDELILWIHPVVMNNGRLLFTTMSGNFFLSLTRKEQTDSGVTVLFYTISSKVKYHDVDGG